MEVSDRDLPVSAASMKPYEYSKVDSKGQEIRLLTLLPLDYCHNVHVTLKNVALNSPPSYEALSYTWGSAQDTVPILIRNDEGFESVLPESIESSTKEPGSWMQHGASQFSTLEVTRNLAVALDQLRLDRKPRVLWVDAICINQQDVQERSAQMQLMGNSYRYAHQMTVWLGPEGNDSSLAMETLSALGSRIGVNWNTWTCYQIEKDKDEYDPVDLGESLGFENRQWAGIERLLKHPWFERLWIWQEVKLANLVCVVCGYGWIDWDALRNAYLRIFAGGNLYTQLSDAITGLFAYGSASAGRSPLLHFVQKTKYCKCSDQRDRTYALLSIPHLPGTQPLEDQGPWIPDYRKDLQILFQDFVLETINDSHNLEPLLLCNLQEQLPGAPSWVPNLPASMLYDDLLYLKAAGDTQAQTVYRGKGILEVSGIFIMAVETTVSINQPESSWKQVIDRGLYEELRRLASLRLPQDRGNLYSCGGTFAEAFCRTIFTNHFTETFYPPKWGMLAFQECFDELLKLIEEPQNECTILDEGLGKMVIGDGRNFSSRNFFTTSEGYIDLVPLAARPGNQVSVLLGCDVPVVLRPMKDGSFLVVGQCYIHGFGSGEALLKPLPLG
ncbi:MAG: hypothetical protein Q9226_004227 [Calogaya cf. arnoldii]